ncbi:hypothetical protein M153_2470003166 [Pseudoloma neurophilia]|uniref:Uncharacterized protein n=1 Tax=Pseudoloma neurophilia TaxID=146866 RepID=A0A0R0LYS1_9MICR|nr:hypothetical protein M153_2470003166 [Pseudoloma neurophilia]
MSESLITIKSKKSFIFEINLILLIFFLWQINPINIFLNKDNFHNPMNR